MFVYFLHVTSALCTRSIKCRVDSRLYGCWAVPLWWDAASLRNDWSERSGCPWGICTCKRHFFPGIGYPAGLDTSVDSSGVRPGSEKHLRATFILAQQERRKERDSSLGHSSGGERQVRQRTAGAQFSPLPADPLTLGKFHSPSAFVTCGCWHH